jgi:CheY-like chemotaxis protein
MNLAPSQGKGPKKAAAKRVLVVDDDPDIAAYMSAALEDDGFHTMQARSAEEAMKRLEQVRPDLICMDIMMPGQSGIALYRKIKLDQRFREIPAVFISAYSMARDFTAEGFRKLVPDRRVPEPEAYIEKPVDMKKVVETVRRIIA